jgi:hypothetical protein
MCIEWWHVVAEFVEALCYKMEGCTTFLIIQIIQNNVVISLCGCEVSIMQDYDKREIKFIRLVKTDYYPGNYMKIQETGFILVNQTH